jgi:hypothetical protein
MGKTITRALRLCCTGLVAGALMLAATGSAFADPPHRDNRSDHGDRGISRDRGDRGNRQDHKSPQFSKDRGGKGSREDYRNREVVRNDRDNDRDRGGSKDRWGGEHRIDIGKRLATWDKDDNRHDRDDHRDRDRHYAPRKRYRDHYYTETKIIYRDSPYVVPHHRKRWYRDVVVVRPYGYWYPGYGHYHHDDDAYKWLSFTAIALKLLDNLNEQQQREHEAAQVAATTAPIGETIIWREGGAAGAVTATREGTTPSGRYCREFLQEVTIGGRKEEAYGTACRQPDGAWEVISVD